MKILLLMIYALFLSFSFMIAFSFSMAGLIICINNHPNIHFGIYLVGWSICWSSLIQAVLLLYRSK